ncbi:MAG: hypothetical protein IJD22_05780 [Clostridia bacterium]|nr:hypothetical protein [Clostridia bacterium]
MRKIISLILAAAAVCLCLIPTHAEECSHNNLREFVSANCLEKGHTKYTCRKCGLVQKVYDDEYTVPDDFYILAKSEREGSTLTVTVNLENNPGLIAARLRVGYNKSTLALREFINGEIWQERDFTGGLFKENNPLSVFTEDISTGEALNTKSGHYFTLVFDIIDPLGSYGLYITHDKADFHKYDNGLVIYTPTLINVVGKSELGPHSYSEEMVAPDCTEEGYTLHTCSYCYDTYKDSFVAPAGHSYEFYRHIIFPNFEEEGLDEFICTGCGATEERTSPVLERWKKGDLNNDGILNAIDTNLIKRIIVGKEVSLQELDAADVCEDNTVNAMDAYLLRVIVAGS